MATQSIVAIPMPDGPMPADWFSPASSGALTPVLSQEIFGVTDYIRGRARDLAAQSRGVLDSFIDAVARSRIREALAAKGALWQGHSGADHAFDNDDAGWYHAEASTAAWAATLEFLRQQLPPDEQSGPGQH